MKLNCYPSKEGLYDPEFEHDACGVGFVAHLKGQQSHNIVSKGLVMELVYLLKCQINL